MIEDETPTLSDQGTVRSWHAIIAFGRYLLGFVFAIFCIWVSIQVVKYECFSQSRNNLSPEKRGDLLLAVITHTENQKKGISFKTIDKDKYITCVVDGDKELRATPFSFIKYCSIFLFFLACIKGMSDIFRWRTDKNLTFFLFETSIGIITILALNDNMIDALNPSWLILTPPRQFNSSYPSLIYGFAPNSYECNKEICDDLMGLKNELTREFIESQGNDFEFAALLVEGYADETPIKKEQIERSEESEKHIDKYTDYKQDLPSDIQWHSNVELSYLRAKTIQLELIQLFKDDEHLSKLKILVTSGFKPHQYYDEQSDEGNSEALQIEGSAPVRRTAVVRLIDLQPEAIVKAATAKKTWREQVASSF